MPLTEKGEKIKAAMSKEYGSEKGERVFYASKNKGTITGVDAGAFGACNQLTMTRIMEAVERIGKRFDGYLSKRK